MHMPLRLCPVFSVVVCLVFDSVLLLLDVKWAKPVRLWAATVCNGPHFVTSSYAVPLRRDEILGGMFKLEAKGQGPTVRGIVDYAVPPRRVDYIF